MKLRGRGSFINYVAVDLNTQLDFLDSDGLHPVSNAIELVPGLRRVIAWAKRNGVPVVSSLDSHRATELPTNGNRLCCIDGSRGQRKLNFTLFPCVARIEFDNTWSVPLDLFDRVQQLIFRQRTNDLLANPKADQFLSHVPAREFVIFGNTIEYSVKALTLGLRARDRQVCVVVDACGFWNAGEADLALRQMEAKGAVLLTIDQLRQRRLADRDRYRRRNGTSNGHGRSPQGPPIVTGGGNGHFRPDGLNAANGSNDTNGSNSANGSNGKLSAAPPDPRISAKRNGHGRKSL